MSPFRLTASLISVVTSLFLAGCSMEPEQIQQLSSMISSRTVSASGSETPATSVRPKKQFDPSFPERVDPFRFPGDEPTAVKPVESIVTTATNIEVLGFAQLDHPRVILRLKNESISLAVGQIHNTVEVLQIAPPAVKLKSGNLVWTATMFDQNKGGGR